MPTLSYYQRNRETILTQQRQRRSNPDFRKKSREYAREYYRRTKSPAKSPTTTEPQTITITRGEFTVEFL